MIKAIFFDIDGTLVSFNTHVISEKTLADLYALKEKGIRLFIASGRHYLVMDNLSGFPFDGYVCMNGALVKMGGETVSENPLDGRVAAEILKRCDENGLPCFIFGGNRVGVTIFNDLTRDVFRMIKLPEVPVLSMSEALDGPVYQLTVFADESQEASLLEGLPKVSASRWFPAFFDLNPEGLSKAEGIGQVISRLGISRDEVMAFGDGGNDVEMLEYAGVGVAMGNASDEVKSHADFVALSVDEDGISHTLRHFGLL